MIIIQNLIIASINCHKCMKSPANYHWLFSTASTSLQAEMATGEIPGTFYGLSDSGWMDSELFINGLSTMHFLVHAPCTETTP